MYANDHWLDHRNFASFDEWRDRQEQCIAPVDSNGEVRLCRMKITHDSQDAANSHRSRAESLPMGSQQRDIAVRDFIIALCCQKHHRSKINSPRLATTLSNLVSDYRQAMRDPYTGHPSRTGSYIESAPRLPVTARFQPFRPTEDDETVTVQEELLQKVDSTFVRTGSVYCATWPASPGFVKIGYTSGPAFDRVVQQRLCLKDAKVEASFDFPYPEKFERLIHRELREKRRIEGFCASCGQTHTEFFEIKAVDAIHVIWEWYRLCQEKVIYDSTRSLQLYWYGKLVTLAGVGEITAYDLLRALYDLPPRNVSTSLETVTMQLGRLSTNTAL